jgi:hypothetical protein
MCPLKRRLEKIPTIYKFHRDETSVGPLPAGAPGAVALCAG